MILYFLHYDNYELEIYIMTNLHITNRDVKDNHVNDFCKVKITKKYIRATTG